VVTTHQVKYEGPSSLAVRVATLLADAEGIDLRSAEKQDLGDGSVDAVVLTLTVEASADDVTEAIGRIGVGLPEGATITAGPVEGP